MNSKERKDQAMNALSELEEAVYETVVNYNYVHRCLTEDFCFELGLTKSEDIEIVRLILNKLKVKGLVENLKGKSIVNYNAWHPSKSAEARERARAVRENYPGHLTP